MFAMVKHIGVVATLGKSQKYITRDSLHITFIMVVVGDMVANIKYPILVIGR